MRKVLPITVLAALILCVVMANIFASQLFPSLMYKVIGLNNPDATKQFLAHIEKTPEYEQQYRYLNSLYNNAFAYEDIQAQFSLQNEVKRYEEKLKENERNPQVFVHIALLYFDQGNTDQARKHYAQAKKVDPWIDINELEELQ